MSVTQRKRVLSRRKFLTRAVAPAAGIVAAGAIGYELPHGSGSPRPSAPASSASSTSSSSAPSTPPPAGVQTFVTRPDLRPPTVRVTEVGTPPAAGSEPRFIFLAPNNVIPASEPQQGLMMIDRKGRLVWFAPVSAGSPFDLNVQSYNGQPALTWWQGTVESAHGEGVGEIGNASYHSVKSIRAGNGLQTDLHDLQLTSRGTALITAYETTTTDLSSVGGSRRGQTFVGHVQEVDLNTGKVLFDWNSLDHVPVSESYQPARSDQGYDYFHLNAVSEMADGNLLVCARNTWALYKVDRSNGNIIWRLGGKKSDFTLSSAARFYWQHDARAHGSSTITVFDNAGEAKEQQSRGLMLSLNAQSKTVDLTQAYLHPAGFISGTLGNVQVLSDGNVFIGWGAQPYFSEYASDGTLLLDGQLPMGVRSYRAYAAEWVGRPGDGPRVVAQANPADGFSVYASWNGQTEIDRWTVLAGKDKSSLSPVGSQAWTGFETAIAVNSQGPYFAVVAYDASGRELGRSPVV
ncbi:MAG TPA: arylsulfotransferase family protein [Solirubrobacteraceae bacterium]|nr:arylsulfotransferase family protein [Solirubrobacteraceae bacterium]